MVCILVSGNELSAVVQFPFNYSVPGRWSYFGVLNNKLMQQRIAVQWLQEPNVECKVETHPSSLFFFFFPLWNSNFVLWHMVFHLFIDQASLKMGVLKTESNLFLKQEIVLLLRNHTGFGEMKGKSL